MLPSCIILNIAVTSTYVVFGHVEQSVYAGIFALLFSATSTFPDDFSDDPSCAGEDLWTWAGSRDGACVTQFAGIAAGS